MDFIYHSFSSTVLILMAESSSALLQYSEIATTWTGQLILAVGLFWLCRRTRALEKQAAVAERGHIIERYNHAVRELESPHRPSVLAAIFTLEHVAKQLAELRYPAFKAMVSQVRTNRGPQFLSAMQATAAVWNPDPLEDVQAILDIIGRRGQWWPREDSESRFLDLSSCDLSGYSLRNCDLSDVNLSGAVLNGTDLASADLRWAEGLERDQMARVVWNESTRFSKENAITSS